jgi:hypothetical protein
MKYKSGNLLEFEFDRNLMKFLLGTSRFDKFWLKGSCVHLYEKSTHEKNLEFQNLEFFNSFLKI